ncbi:MAG: hypothetical protein P1U47_06820 [Zhongshania sp.]|uniref:hypothetical protein n=1 Tax=Zhongshania sp. TaxID=1971902 RepID=UPI0026294FF2|nr:hypothetical protein [Zhongshania sp.]MDF1692064.1 hypothetical protein [Zhongshania sp.]
MTDRTTDSRRWRKGSKKGELSSVRLFIFTTLDQDLDSACIGFHSSTQPFQTPITYCWSLSPRQRARMQEHTSKDE